MQSLLRAALAFALLALAASARAEAASAWVDLVDVRARLVAAADGLDGDGRATLGLHIRLAPGWKTYWREPGEAGLPPRLDWSAAGNLADATLAYPAPHRFQSFGLTSLGYVDEVVFPIAVRAADPARPLAARVGVDFMICEAVCVPAHADLALELAPAASAASVHAALIQRFADRVPTAPAAAGIAFERVALDGDELRVVATSATPFAAPDLMVEADGRVGFGAPAVHLEDDGRRASLRLPVGVPGLAGREIVLTLIDGDRAVEQQATVPAE